MANPKGYQAIEREAIRLGWPEHWATDLTVHDYRALCAEDAPETFGWGIRDTGTDLFRVESEVAVKWAKACHTNRVDQKYYWYDGKTLTEISLEEMIERLTASAKSAPRQHHPEEEINAPDLFYYL